MTIMMTKESNSFSRNFLILAIVKLFLIQSIFLWVGIIMADKGQGTFIQFPIFYSWLVFPVSFLSYFKSSPDTISSVLMFYCLSIPIIFFLFSITMLSLIWRGKIKKTRFAKFIICHFLGAIFVIVFSIHEAWLFYPYESLTIYLWVEALGMSLLASVLFWYNLFQVINYKSNQPHPHEKYPNKKIQTLSK